MEIREIIKDYIRQSHEKLIDDIMKKIERDDPLLIDIMKTIPWKLEQAYNAKRNHNGLSRYVFDEFANTVGDYINKPIWIFQLDRDSPAWRQCNSELVFTDFTPDASAGGRRRRAKTVRRRRSTRRSRSRRS